MTVKLFSEVIKHSPSKFIFTTHAISRLKLFNITQTSAIEEIKHSILSVKDYTTSKFKPERGLYHFVNGNHIYTIKQPRTGLILVITASNTIINIKSRIEKIGITKR